MQFLTDRIITLAALFDDLQQHAEWADPLTPRQAEQIRALLDATALEQVVQIRLALLNKSGLVDRHAPAGTPVMRSGCCPASPTASSGSAP